MADDLTRAGQLKARNPQKALIIHYEDVAKHATTAAQHIYRWASDEQCFHYHYLA